MSMAEKANLEGNVLYKGENYAQEAMQFTEAMQLDVTEPKYPSNLSATLYENEKYAGALGMTRYVWNILREKHVVKGQSSTPPSADPLTIRLATRFANAYSHGVCCGAISLHEDEEDEDGFVPSGRRLVKLITEKTVQDDIEKFVTIHDA